MSLKKVVLILVVAVFMLSVSGCGKDKPAEEAGKKIDRAVEDAKKKVTKLLD